VGFKDLQIVQAATSNIQRLINCLLSPFETIYLLHQTLTVVGSGGQEDTDGGWELGEGDDAAAGQAALPDQVKQQPTSSLSAFIESRMYFIDTSSILHQYFIDQHIS
jgi:hypothetical protein